MSFLVKEEQDDFAIQSDCEWRELEAIPLCRDLTVHVTDDGGVTGEGGVNG